MRRSCFVELAGARWTGEADVRGELPSPPVVRYDPAYADAVLGLEIPEDEQRERLTRLGFDVTDDWTVTTPSWRARDVRATSISWRKSVASGSRTCLPASVRQAMFGRLTHFQRLRRVVEDVLVGAGYYEAYTYSLQATDPRPECDRVTGAAHVAATATHAPRSV